MRPRNTRKTERYALRIDIEYSAALAGEAWHKAMTRNLSVGGAFVETQTSPPFESKLRLRFSVPTHPKPIEVGGTVRWCDSEGFGVQFDGLRAQETWAIGKYMEHKPV